jgi:hypothetical protein
MSPCKNRCRALCPLAAGMCFFPSNSQQPAHGANCVQQALGLTSTGTCAHVRCASARKAPARWILILLKSDGYMPQTDLVEEVQHEAR